MPGTSAFLDKHRPQPQEFVQHYAHARDRNPKSPALRNSPHYFAKYWTLRMGGFGSGRGGGRPTTDSCLTLDLSQLRRDGLFRLGFAGAGSLIWTNTKTGERTGSIGYEAHLGEENGRVRLHYTTTRRDGEKRESDYWIQLETTPQPFGGRRWWFICPRTGLRAAKLYLPTGAFTFASRRAYRLAYACQREPAHDRASRRAFKLRGKLGAEGGIGDHISKPKWMRWRTYDRKLDEIFAAEWVVEAHMETLNRATLNICFE
jgi:hypothetical protein